MSYKSDGVEVGKNPEKRRLHKALLRYHDPKNGPMIRAALKDLKLDHLNGPGTECANGATARQQLTQFGA